MTLKEQDIVHENGKFWVHAENPAKGLYKLYKAGVTHSTLAGTFHFSSAPERALALAIKECDARASAE